MSNQGVLLVLPYPAQGHVNSLMNFSRNLAENGFKILFINTDFNHKRIMASFSEQDQILTMESNIRFVSISDGLGSEEDRNDLGKLCSALMNSMPAMLEKLIEDIRVHDRISCLVADVNMGWALEVADKLGIRGAVLWTASAAMFALQYSIPRMIHDGIIDCTGSPIQKKKFQLSPSMPTMNIDQIFWSNMGDEECQKHIFHYVKGFTQVSNLTEWWLCNTTYELEPGPLSFIPKLLPIGPFLGSSNHSKRSMGQFWKEDLSCLSWLDQQPPCSVIYVAFGSFTLLKPNQFKELALGLELIKRPFLWVVRSDGNSRNEYPDEFQGNHGKIVGWAPQWQVLSHPATACFISHCGWNSTIEALCNEVPLLCWPYFGDQIYNKHFICDELKVGLGFETDEKGIVSSMEIKKKVEQLVKDENIRVRSMKLKEMLISNIAEGGRSLENFNKFVKWLRE